MNKNRFDTFMYFAIGFLLGCFIGGAWYMPHWWEVLTTIPVCIISTLYLVFGDEWHIHGPAFEVKQIKKQKEEA